MKYEYLISLKKHPAWRLLLVDSAPLIISFFHSAFIQPNRRAIAAGELVAKLDDYLYRLREVYAAACSRENPPNILMRGLTESRRFSANIIRIKAMSRNTI